MKAPKRCLTRGLKDGRMDAEPHAHLRVETVALIAQHTRLVVTDSLHALLQPPLPVQGNFDKYMGYSLYQTQVRAFLAVKSPMCIMLPGMAGLAHMFVLSVATLLLEYMLFSSLIFY
jgi:hypothetical protein